MIEPFLSGVMLIVGLLIADAAAQPRNSKPLRLRSVRGMGVLIGAGAGLQGLCLALTGAWTPSMVLVVLLAGVISLVSNIKRQVLGEPLVFTDFALVGAIFQHPHFYFSALKPWQIGVIVIGLATLVLVAVMFSTDALPARGAGLALVIAAGLWLKALAASPYWRKMADAPDVDRDVREHGLIATLLIYWQLWSRLPVTDAKTLPPVESAAKQLVVIVQCESFADPADLFDDPGKPLTGLETARSLAWRSGRLMVSGFGAYTMRTEFGAIFGIDEDELGLNRFDPFLTAQSAANASLAHRLGGPAWSRVFLHPHDMRFYGRDKLMPAAGFDTLVDDAKFAALAPSDGRYITDESLCDKLLEIAGKADASTLIYAVTIENHGPWSAGEGNGPDANKNAYLRLLGRSDAMLSRLIEQLPQFGRPVTLCFFGDHRPSIPKVCTPGGDKHTPFVILRFDENGVPIRSAHPVMDMTPAELHHAVLEAAASG